MNNSSLFIFLLASGINEKELQQTESVDLEELFSLSRRHSLECGMGSLLKKNGFELPEMWQKAVHGAIYQKALVQYETEQLFAWFEKEKIWYLPLKGWILQDFWPSDFLRQKGDVDLLVDPARMEDIRNHMEKIGYTTENFGRGYHDEYYKAPIFRYEIHPCLIPQGVQGHNYYRDIKSRLHKAPGKEYEFRFSDEDFLIFLLVHGHKHWQTGGIGFRALTDIYVWKKTHPSLDEAYIAKELRKLELSEFGGDFCSLADKLLTEPSMSWNLTDKETKMLSYLDDAGTFGTIENRVNHEESKWKYFLRRLFPPVSFFRERYPRFSAPFLPAFWLYWILGNLFLNFNSVRKIMNAFLKKR